MFDATGFHSPPARAQAFGNQSARDKKAGPTAPSGYELVCDTY